MKKKKRFRHLSELKRRNPVYEANKRIIIITEGTKTEHTYFKLLQREMKLPSMLLQIMASNGSAPKNVVETARRQLLEANKNEIGTIYCVFDYDRHSTFDEAIRDIALLSNRSQNKCLSIVPIPSVPCFEYWFLLHVRYTRKNYNDADSPCDALIEDLRKFKKFENYRKPECINFFHNIKELRTCAITNSKRVIKEASRDSEKKYYENPSTRVHILVEELRILREASRQKNS